MHFLLDNAALLDTFHYRNDLLVKKQNAPLLLPYHRQFPDKAISSPEEHKGQERRHTTWTTLQFDFALSTSIYQMLI